MTNLEHLAFLGRQCRQVGDGPVQFLDGLPPPTQTELDASRDAALAFYKPKKIWPNAEAFVAEFTMSELSAISLATNTTIAALRFMLSTWSGEIHSDDPRVMEGLFALFVTNTMSSTRLSEIIAP